MTGFTGALAVLLLAGAAPGEATAPLSHVRALAIAASAGDFSESSLGRAFAGMDSSMLALARRLAPMDEPWTAALADTGASAAAPTAQPNLSLRTLEGLSWDSARLINASVPLSHERNPAAQPFFLRASPQDEARALNCLTQAVYYEAAFEPLEGKAAVAQVVLNRLRHPVYPNTVCGVVFQGSRLPTGCQFTFTCDGALGQPPVKWAWEQARYVAERALHGHVAASVGSATHYHADYVVPYWMPTLSKVAQIGAHIFYRWPGGMGLPAAFVDRYAGNEPTAEELAGPSQTLLAEDSTAWTPELAAAVGVVVETAPARIAAEPIVVAEADFTAPVAPTLRMDPVTLDVPAEAPMRAAPRLAVPSGW